MTPFRHDLFGVLIGGAERKQLFKNVEMGRWRRMPGVGKFIGWESELKWFGATCKAHKNQITQKL